VELEGNMVEACKKAGVEKIVLNSALGAGDYDKSFPSWHGKWKTLEELGNGVRDFATARIHAEHTGVFGAEHTRAGSVLRRDGRYEDDLCGCAGCRSGSRKVLIHAGTKRVYELNGPEAITQTKLQNELR